MKLRLFLALAALSGSACAGSRHYRPLEEGVAAGAPHFLELREAARVATLHFPAGTYVLEASDDAGFFYRAPAKIRENSFSGAFFHNGGVYLSKSRPPRLRGYVYWYGGLTHVGNLSRVDYVLQD